MQEEFPAKLPVTEEFPAKIPKPFIKIDAVNTPQTQKPVTVLKQRQIIVPTQESYTENKVYHTPGIFGQEKFSVSMDI